mmetsp:Transcript_14789/g.32229  ORF Transcript_14789/g.32229 Transcript_14789/m.32229 type:complete len:85 (-) Transcript_14789:1662-1916(-)
MVSNGPSIKRFLMHKGFNKRGRRLCSWHLALRRVDDHCSFTAPTSDKSPTKFIQGSCEDPRAFPDLYSSSSESRDSTSPDVLRI